MATEYLTQARSREGQTGRCVGNGVDWDDVLKDAQEKMDFEYVLTQRVDRATRGRRRPPLWLEFGLKKRGIRVLYPEDGLPDGIPLPNTLRAARADAAQETAISTSQRGGKGETGAGDLNFDALVDGADYGVIDNFVRFPGTDGYSNGDIKYDGLIDGADYRVIDNTIQLQGAPFPAGTYPAVATGVSAMPEPASLSVLGVAARRLPTTV